MIHLFLPPFHFYHQANLVSLREVLKYLFSHINRSHFPQIKLADKQAALEKIQWEAMTSTKKVEKLQDELGSMQADISSFTLLLEGLSKTDTAKYTDNYDVKPYDFSPLPSIVSLWIFFKCTQRIFPHVYGNNFNTALWFVYQRAWLPLVHAYKFSDSINSFHFKNCIIKWYETINFGGREWKQYWLFGLFVICFHVPFLFHSFYFLFHPSVYLCFLEQNCVSMHEYLILGCWPFE